MSQNGFVPVRVLFDEQPSGDGQLSFKVAVYDVGYEAGLDIRCH